MAGVANTARVSARLASRYAVRSQTPRRAFRTCTRYQEAQNYTMPALSPTMSEGNIAGWKIKEGDSFSAGDVLLEIETDKATMDVEAQDDGVVFKIMQGDGAKGVKVGERIAVFADPGDDLGSLEVPADDSEVQSQSEAKEEPTSSSQKEEESRAKSSQHAEQEESKQARAAASPSNQASSAQQESSHSSGGKHLPLLPAVQQLLHQNGYSNEEASKISATGPNGRLLKGDVLAYLGQVQKDYPSKEAQRIEKRSHLDLSNITIAPPKSDPKSAKQKPAAVEPELPSETDIALPISLASVIATQKRVQDSLGIFLPLSTFIARASELANEDLPLSRKRKPSADELFNSVLGLDRVDGVKTSRGHFIPQITGITPPIRAVPVRKPDIIDLLAPKKVKKQIPKVPTVPPAAVGVSLDGNVFSVIAAKGEEERAVEYLERMKHALEESPGRLVL